MAFDPCPRGRRATPADDPCVCRRCADARRMSGRREDPPVPDWASAVVPDGYRVPVGYALRLDGVWLVRPRSPRLLVTATPVLLVHVRIHPHGYAHTRANARAWEPRDEYQLALYRDGAWSTVHVDRTELGRRGDRGEALTRAGVHYPRGYPARVDRWVHRLKALNRDALGVLPTSVVEPAPMAT